MSLVTIMLYFNDLLIEGYGVCIFLLFFEFNSIQTVGYMNWIGVIFFSWVLIPKINAKRHYRELLAIDYLLITILLPLQIMGRIIGTALNFKTLFIINFSLMLLAMCFLLWKLYFKAIAISAEELKGSEIYTGRYISLNILKSSSVMKENSNKESSSNSSFSADSNMAGNNFATPYQIQEESWEESSHKGENFVFPSEVSDQYSSYSYSSKRKQGK